MNLSVTKKELEIHEALQKLKMKSGSHSPSIQTLKSLNSEVIKISELKKEKTKVPKIVPVLSYKPKSKKSSTPTLKLSFTLTVKDVSLAITLLMIIFHKEQK